MGTVADTMYRWYNVCVADGLPSNQCAINTSQGCTVSMAGCGITRIFPPVKNVPALWTGGDVTGETAQFGW